MEKVKNVSYETRYINMMFYSVVLMLLPFILVQYTGDNSLLIPSMGFLFIISISLIIYYRFQVSIKINKNGLIYTLIYGSILLMPLIMNIFFANATNSLDILNGLASVLIFFIYFTLPLNIKISEQTIYKLHVKMIKFALLSCIYNIIVNLDDLLTINMLTNSYDAAFQSFFSNRNQYGAFLFIALTVLDILDKTKISKKKVVLLYIILFINLLLTMSRGAILASLVYFSLSFLSKKKANKDWIFLCSFICIVIFVFLNDSIRNIIKDYIIRPDHGSTGRSSLWSLGLQIYEENSLLFGTGGNTALDMAKDMGMTRSEFHSFYIEALLSSGIIGLLFIVFILFVIIKKHLNEISYKNKRIKLKLRIISFLCLGLVESVNVFSLGYVGIFFSVFIITLPLLMSNEERNSINEN